MSSVGERLCLCDQGITRMECLELPNLRELLLHQNALTRMEGLDGCPRLQKLWLASNKIPRIEGHAEEARRVARSSQASPRPRSHHLEGKLAWATPACGKGKQRPCAPMPPPMCAAPMCAAIAAAAAGAHVLQSGLSTGEPWTAGWCCSPAAM